MIAFICNKCKRPIDLSEKQCAHMKIMFGEGAIVHQDKYSFASGYDIDLCEKCYKEIAPMIDHYYYAGNQFVERKENT